MREVKVSLKASGEESADIIVYGEMERNERGSLIAFSESTAEGKRIDTKIIYGKRGLSVSRSGEMKLVMNFCENEENELPIETEHGIVSARLVTRRLSVSESESGVSFSIVYDLFFESYSSNHEIFIDVEII